VIDGSLQGKFTGNAGGLPSCWGERADAAGLLPTGGIRHDERPRAIANRGGKPRRAWANRRGLTEGSMETVIPRRGWLAGGTFRSGQSGKFEA